MKEKIAIIGAGSAMFTRGLVADVIKKGWACELALVDIDENALNVAERLVAKMVSARRSPIKLSASVDRRDALENATVVISLIGVGGRRAWEKDVFIPREYGIFQPVGDSVMPGGASRALRMIPAMTAIAEDVMDLAPDALFFNYANPMSATCRGVRKATGADITGLCHGVFHIGNHLASLLNVKPDRLKYSAVGINHLTWFVETRVDGADAMPALAGIADRKLGGINRDRLGEVFAEAGNVKRDNPAKEADNPFSWMLFRRFGAFPAVFDRHITEFFPWLFRGKGAYFGKTLGVDCYSFEKVIEYGDKIFEEMCEKALSPDPLPENYFERISGEHEQATDIIESVRLDKGMIFSVNLPNTGQVPNLPRDAVIECPAVADAGGLRSIVQPALPAGAASVVAGRLMWVETVVEAALERSRDKFIQALIADGSLGSVEAAEKLADDMINAQSQYLGGSGFAAPKA